MMKFGYRGTVGRQARIKGLNMSKDEQVYLYCGQEHRAPIKPNTIFYSTTQHEYSFYSAVLQ